MFHPIILSFTPFRFSSSLFALQDESCPWQIVEHVCYLLHWFFRCGTKINWRYSVVSIKRVRLRLSTILLDRWKSKTKKNRWRKLEKSFRPAKSDEVRKVFSFDRSIDSFYRSRKVREKLLLDSDSDLAHRLQQEECNSNSFFEKRRTKIFVLFVLSFSLGTKVAVHYDRNRADRRESGLSLKAARVYEEQEKNEFLAKEYQLLKFKQKMCESTDFRSFFSEIRFFFDLGKRRTLI